MESITGGNTPKYQELTEQLRLQIVSVRLHQQKLLSENTLSAQYQVSCRQRKALAILQNEGQVYRARARHIPGL